MRNLELADQRGQRWLVEVASSRSERTRGLRGRARLEPGHAMLIPRCRSVHTIGMRFPLAVVFLDRGWRVIEVRQTPPGRILRPRLRARHILECPDDVRLQLGDRLLPSEPLTQARSRPGSRDPHS